MMTSTTTMKISTTTRMRMTSTISTTSSWTWTTSTTRSTKTTGRCVPAGTTNSAGRVRRHVPLVAALVLYTAALARPVAAQSPTPASGGRVAGTVTLSTTLAKRRPNFRIYSDAGPGSVPPQTRTDPAAELRNVVIYIESAPDTRQPAVVAREDLMPSMAQSGEKFIPHVLPI